MRLFHKLENATYLPRDGISHPVIFFTILVPIHRARMQDSATSTTRATNTLDVENYITWATRISQDKSMMEFFFECGREDGPISFNALPRLTADSSGARCRWERRGRQRQTIMSDNMNTHAETQKTVESTERTIAETNVTAPDLKSGGTRRGSRPVAPPQKGTTVFPMARISKIIKVCLCTKLITRNRPILQWISAARKQHFLLVQRRYVCID